MRRLSCLAASALVVAACHAGDRPLAPSTVARVDPPDIRPDAPSAPIKVDAPPATRPAPIEVVPQPPTRPVPVKAMLPPSAPAGGGHDFTADGKALLVVGACGDGQPPQGFDAQVLAAHCEVITRAQADYLAQWVKPARAFFSEKVPRDVPKRVVYPFAGGDLSTALTVYPDADEITTLSLEPAGDPRALGQLSGRELAAALRQVAFELKFLYRVNFSNTLNMIDAMREGALPTQLIFGLSALKTHGYEVVALRYFRLAADGSPRYLDAREVAAAPAPSKARPQVRNRIFANVEVQFRKPGGRIQVYRHLQQNLDNEHLKADPRVLKHLEAKGATAGMTKAASYLLSWDSFSMMRDYLTGHVTWMVSDATGVAPKWGKPAGFEYETYGGFVGPHIPAGGSIQTDWRLAFDAEPRRELGFRFGYYDKKSSNHLVIMRKKKS
jgi:hypothetical protein